MGFKGWQFVFAIVLLGYWLISKRSSEIHCHKIVMDTCECESSVFNCVFCCWFIRLVEVEVTFVPIFIYFSCDFKLVFAFISFNHGTILCVWMAYKFGYFSGVLYHWLVLEDTFKCWFGMLNKLIWFCLFFLTFLLPHAMVEDEN